MHFAYDSQELQLDQQAKKHLQEEFDASLEEKDQFISVLQTQVRCLAPQMLFKAALPTQLFFLCCFFNDVFPIMHAHVLL